MKDAHANLEVASCHSIAASILPSHDSENEMHESKRSRNHFSKNCK